MLKRGSTIGLSSDEINTVYAVIYSGVHISEIDVIGVFMSESKAKEFINNRPRYYIQKTSLII